MWAYKLSHVDKSFINSSSFYRGQSDDGSEAYPWYNQAETGTLSHRKVEKFLKWTFNFTFIVRLCDIVIVPSQETSNSPAISTFFIFIFILIYYFSFIALVFSLSCSCPEVFVSLPALIIVPGLAELAVLQTRCQECLFGKHEVRHIFDSLYSYRESNITSWRF